MQSYFHFTREDEMLVGRLSSLWEEFLIQLQDAVEHVTQQTPLMIQTLDKKLQVCLRVIITLTKFVKFL